MNDATQHTVQHVVQHVVRHVVRKCASLALVVSVLVGPSAAAAQEGGDEASGQAVAKAADVADLVKALRPKGVLRVRFTENLTLPFLTDPITSRGVLTVRADGLILRHVLAPNPSAVAMHGSTVVMRDASGTSRMDLSASAEAGAAVSLLRALVVGDVARLASRYTLERIEDSGSASGSGSGRARWSIRLTPKRAEEKAIFTACEVVAHGEAIERITLHESDGSVRVIAFDEATRTAALTDEDRKLLKSLGLDDATAR